MNQHNSIDLNLHYYLNLEILHVFLTPKSLVSLEICANRNYYDFTGRMPSVSDPVIIRPASQKEVIRVRVLESSRV